MLKKKKLNAGLKFAKNVNIFLNLLIPAKNAVVL
jgi:hypothetical protein